jgi:hypothetical protein
MGRSADPNTDDGSQTTSDVKGPRFACWPAIRHTSRLDRRDIMNGHVCSCSSKRTRMGRPPQAKGLSHRDANSYSR